MGCVRNPFCHGEYLPRTTRMPNFKLVKREVFLYYARLPADRQVSKVVRGLQLII